MPIEVILPKVDMDMATGKILRWNIHEGAVVAKGDVLFEMETDKSAMDVEAPASGTLQQISAKEGDDVPVGMTVAWIYAEGEGFDAGVLPVSKQQTVPAAPVETSAPQKSATAVLPVPGVSGDGIRATPLARRISREQNIDLVQVQGSGPHGRIFKADIEAFMVSQQKPALSMPASGSAMHPTQIDDTLYERIPHDTMRKTIARRLTEAKTTIPHFYLTTDCEIDNLLDLRTNLNKAAPIHDRNPAYKISVNDMVIKAMAMALQSNPDANVSWADDHMLRYRHVNLGVAVSIPGGLMTPVIRQAEIKSLSSISNEMKDLAERARLRKLKPEEYQGGTAAISNLGMFGVREFLAIINPPHASILAVGAGQRRAIIRDNDEIVAATVMSLSLSCDHRAIDGALGAQLLSAVKHALENPYLMLV